MGTVAWMSGLSGCERLRGVRWVEKMGTGTAGERFVVVIESVPAVPVPIFSTHHHCPFVPWLCYSSSPSIRWVLLFIRCPFHSSWEAACR